MDANAVVTSMTGGYDIEKIRSDFPILSRKIHGKPLVYLDSAASAQKPKVVIDALVSAYCDTYSNVHRGLHFLSEASTDAYEAVRGKVAHFIGAKSGDEIVLTAGATMALNMIAQCWALPRLKAGDEILISIAEHHANIVPWQMVAGKTGAVLRAFPVDEDGSFNMLAFTDMISARTKIVSVPHVSNVLGTVFPVAEMAKIAHDANALMVVDGCQGVVHMPVDVQALDADFYVFSAHKLYGPNGVGILWGKAEILAELPPFLGGGDMIDRVTIEKSTYALPPHRFEAGTPAIAEAIALGADGGGRCVVGGSGGRWNRRFIFPSAVRVGCSFVACVGASATLFHGCCVQRHRRRRRRRRRRSVRRPRVDGSPPLAGAPDVIQFRYCCLFLS